MSTIPVRRVDGRCLADRAAVLRKAVCDLRLAAKERRRVPQEVRGRTQRFSAGVALAVVGALLVAIGLLVWTAPEWRALQWFNWLRESSDKANKKNPNRLASATSSEEGDSTRMVDPLHPVVVSTPRRPKASRRVDLPTPSGRGLLSRQNIANVANALVCIAFLAACSSPVPPPVTPGVERVVVRERTPLRLLTPEVVIERVTQNRPDVTLNSGEIATHLETTAIKELQRRGARITVMTKSGLESQTTLSPGGVQETPIQRLVRPNLDRRAAAELLQFSVPRRSDGRRLGSACPREDWRQAACRRVSKRRSRSESPHEFLIHPHCVACLRRGRRAVAERGVRRPTPSG